MSADEFALERLRQNPDLGFDALRKAAESEGIPLLPIHYGRARRQLGLIASTNQRTEDASAEAGAAAEATEQQAEAPTATPTPGPGLSRPSTPAFEFLVEELRREPTISYGELKTAADARGLKIAPIMYGRAKALLGLVPVRPRGQGKNRKKQGVAGLTRAESASAEQFAQQLEAVRDIEGVRAIARQLDQERRQLREALERLAQLIDESLN